MRGNRRERANALSAIPNLACRDGRLIPVPVDAAPHGNPRLLFHDDMIGLRKEGHPALVFRCASARNRMCNMGHASHSTWIRCPICIRDNAHGCRNIRRLPAACTVPGWLTALSAKASTISLDSSTLCRRSGFVPLANLVSNTIANQTSSLSIILLCRQCLCPFSWNSIHPV